MRTILFDYPGSKLDGRQYALNMRVSYLLSGAVMCMGTNVDCYSFIENLSRFSRKQKILLLSGDQPEFKEWSENVRSLRKQVKYHNGHLISASRKIDDAVDNYFNKWTQWLTDSFYAKGFPAISQDQLDESPAFQMQSHVSEPELDDDSNCPFSEWLQLTQEEDEQGDMVMMPANFMDHPAVKDHWVEASDPTAGDINGIYFKHCITLPKISSLTLLEMNSIRKAIASPLQSFTSSMNNWIDQFWNEDGLEVDTMRFFNNNILPAAEGLQAAYDRNLILKHLLRTTNAADRVEVLIGEVPVKLIWRYFKDNKVIPNPTWQKLQKAVLRDDRLTRRWPVIAVRSNDVMWSLPATEMVTNDITEGIDTTNSISSL
jgi:hypothetical protein